MRNGSCAEVSMLLPKIGNLYQPLINPNSDTQKNFPSYPTPRNSQHRITPEIFYIGIGAYTAHTHDHQFFTTSRQTHLQLTHTHN